MLVLIDSLVDKLSSFLIEEKILIMQMEKAFKDIFFYF